MQNSRRRKFKIHQEELVNGKSVDKMIVKEWLHQVSVWRLQSIIIEVLLFLHKYYLMLLIFDSRVRKEVIDIPVTLICIHFSRTTNVS